MYTLKIRYLASVFLDAESLAPDPERISGFLEALNDEELLPVPALEKVGDSEVRRIAFSSTDTALRLVIGTNRINMSLHPTLPDGENMGELSEFLEHAAQKLGAVLGFLGRRVHRIATAQEGILPDMKKKDLERVGKRVLSLPPSLSNDPPFEWDWRIASGVDREFGGVKEVTNAVITLKRLAGSWGAGGEIEREFNSIRMDLDLNTSAKNTVDRFTPEHVMAFVRSSVDWHASLSTEILEWLKE